MGLFERQMESYGSYHSHPKNKILHIIGTPLIIYSILGAASHFDVPLYESSIELHWLIATTLAVWYVFFHLLYGGLAAVWILFLASIVPLLWQLPEAPRWVFIATMQIAGWAILFSGHALRDESQHCLIIWHMSSMQRLLSQLNS